MFSLKKPPAGGFFIQHSALAHGLLAGLED